MSEQLCIIYEVRVPPKNSASQISDDFYPTKQEALEVARENNREVRRIRVRGDGGIRRAVCRLAKHQSWVLSAEKIADFSQGERPTGA
jgi:hypothetical protein